MIKQFAKALNDDIRREMNTICDAIADNGCQTLEDYKFRCGQIRGLAMAEDYLTALLEKVERDE